MEIELKLNGEWVSRQVEPSLTLLRFIRDELGWKGTKEGCGEGECGACTVIVAGKAVNSCLYPVVNTQGLEVTTIEGLAGADHRLDPAQEALVAHGGVQCGYCTAGMVMSIKAFSDQCKTRGHVPDRDEISKNLEGNLCRCTGYVKIVDAAASLFVEGDS